MNRPGAIATASSVLAAALLLAGCVSAPAGGPPSSDDHSAELLDERLRTFDNGFVGLWLPRGIESVLTIRREGRSTTVEVSTAGPDAQTCITTARLT